MQAKFLRVLQEREFQRLGGSRTIKADVRVIAATNRDPRLAMERGTLREDLYYRLSVFEIALPPLRERREDILLLASAFLQEVGTSVGRPAAGISEDAREQLLRHAWPGNVRELRNAIERAVILCEGGLISSEHLPIALAAPAATIERAGRGASMTCSGRRRQARSDRARSGPEGTREGAQQQVARRQAAGRSARPVLLAAQAPRPDRRSTMNRAPVTGRILAATCNAESRFAIVG